MPIVLLSLAAITASLLVGLFLGVGFWQGGAALAGIVPLVIFYALFINLSPEKKDAVFWVMFAWVIVSNIVLATTNLRLSALLELALFLYAPLAIYFSWETIKKTPLLPFLIMLLTAYYIFAATSSIMGQSKPIATLFQMVTNLKFFLVIVIGMSLVWSEKSNRLMLWVMRWFWLPMLAMALLQLASPSLFKLIYPFGVHSAWNDIIGMPKAAGLFRHASYLGFYSAFFMFLTLITWATTRHGRYLLLASIYFLLVILSGARHELLSSIIIAAVILTLALGKKKQGLGLRIIFGITIMLSILGTVGITTSEYLERQALKMNIIGNKAPDQPRSVLHFDAFDIANENFPLGSGLATFGSAGAAKYDWRLYDERGFRSFGWYEINWASDTFWPQYIAEAGWLGFIFYFSIFVVLIIYAFYMQYKTFGSNDRIYWLYAISGILMVVMLSPASPAIEDPGLALLPAIFYGIALRRQSSNVNN